MLTGSLNQHNRGVAGAAFEQGPLHAVGHGRCCPSFLGRNPVGNLVDHRVGGEVQVGAEAAPKTGSCIDGGVAIPDRVVVVESIGGGAVTVLAHMVPFASAAREIVLQEHQITLFDAFAFRE